MYLHFQLISCTVENTDILSQPDIFCEICFQNSKKRTVVIEDTCTPVWAGKGEFFFPFDENGEDSVFVDIYDSDGWRDEHVKSVSFQLRPQPLNRYDFIDDMKDGIEVKYRFVYMVTSLDLEKIRQETVEDVRLKLNNIFS